MKSPVVVVDYGRGNIFSVRQALESCGAEVVLASEPSLLASAERVILPGVGAFGDGMQGLRDRGLVEPLRDYARTGRPLLGICLGMQMLLESSEEFGRHEGLGLIPGRVVPIPSTALDGRPHKVPHIGWNSLLSQGQDWQAGLLHGVTPGSAVYFVHSFMAVPDQAEGMVAHCDYNGRPIGAVIRKGNIWGCQFHPEKSAKTGLRILMNFVRLQA